MTIIQQYTPEGVQNLINGAIDAEGISEFELAKRSGVHATTIHNILHGPRRPQRIRRSTIRKIAESTGFRCSFTQDSNILLEKFIPKQDADTELEKFANDMCRLVLASGRDNLTGDEKFKISEVVRLLLQKQKENKYEKQNV